MKKGKATQGVVPEGLLQSSRNRTVAFTNNIRAAMKQIELEIDQNQGLYPFNGGRLTQAELCRRAKVTNVALQGPAHKDTTRVMVDAWLKTVRAGITTGRKSVRRTVTDRADNWKAQHAAVATAYHIAVLEMNEMKLRVRDLEREAETLREHLRLRSEKRVVTMPPTK